MSNLTYDYDELIKRSEDISTFSTKFEKEVDYLSTIIQNISSNLQTTEASRVYNALDAIKEQEDEIKDAIDKFAISIREDIAPTYQTIETNLKNEATEYYE